MAYFGPEVAMPLASLVAGLAGLILLFWRRFVAAMKRAFRWTTRPFRKGGGPAPEAQGPDAS